MVMIMVNIAEAKAKLSEFVEAVTRGEQVIICKHNRPVAELRSVEATRTAPRDLTPMFPDWKIAPSFFDPLDDDEIAAWEGRAGDELLIAEERASYKGVSKPRRGKRS
jgi:prevent-host-death family protein